MAKPSKKTDAVDEDVAGILDSIREGGDEGAQILGSAAMALKIRGVISTQAPSLDAAIGRGGVPLGRLTILHGPEGGGKTTLALHLVAETQRLGGIALYQDMEYKLDPDYAASIGVKTKRLIISQPRTLEAVVATQLSVIEAVAKRREKTGVRTPVLIVNDSINACIPKSVLEGETDEHFPAAAARKWSEQIPKLIAKASKEDVALVYISQVRKKFNVMFGDGDEYAGGQAPRFYASLIMKVYRTGKIKDSGGDAVANKTEVEIKKNQIAPPFKKAMLECRYGVGFDRGHSLITTLLEEDSVYKRVGTNINCGEELFAKSLEKAAKRFNDDPKMRRAVEREYRERRGWSYPVASEPKLAAAEKA
jgi:recombination protein RecA